MTAASTVGTAALGMEFLGFQEGPTCLCPQIGPFLLMLVMVKCKDGMSRKNLRNLDWIADGRTKRHSEVLEC